MSVQPLRPASSRAEALFADPLISRDLLLIALAWDQLLTPDCRMLRWVDVARMTGIQTFQARELLRRDVPSYEPPTRPERCQHLGPRGGRCPHSAAQWGAKRDPDDGATAWVGWCRLVTHRAWGENRVRQHKDALDVRVPPKPAYNTRSRIAHHFDEIDFPTWWANLTADSAEPMRYDVTRDPDRGGSLLIQRPRLRVVMQP